MAMSGLTSCAEIPPASCRACASARSPPSPFTASSAFGSRIASTPPRTGRCCSHSKARPSSNRSPETRASSDAEVRQVAVQLRRRSPSPASAHDRRRRVRTWYRGAQSLVQEALEAASVEVLADVDIASTVHRDRMRHVERAAKQSLLPEAGDHLQRLAIQDPDVMVRAVDHVEKPLLRIG